MSEASRRPAFVKNEGYPESVLYRTDGGGVRLFLTADALIWVYKVPPDDVWGIVLLLPEGAPLRPLERAPSLISLVRSPEQMGGSSQERWSAVRYVGVWPGIDLTLRIGASVDWIFDLAPGADPGELLLVWDGVGLVHVDDEGDLILREGDLQLYHPRPQAFQEGEAVPVRYQLRGTRKVGFWLGPHDPGVAVQIRVVHP